MKSWRISILIIVITSILGCSDSVPPPPQASDEAQETQEEANTSMTMQGIDLYMHKPELGNQDAGKPELWVRAESLTIGEENIYHFEHARAVIYGRDASEEVTINAKRGFFEQDARAMLEGDVTLEAGTLHMLLRDIQWVRPEDGTTGAAFSDNPVIIDDPDLQLNASSLRLYPDTQQFELDNVTGMVRFGGNLL